MKLIKYKDTYARDYIWFWVHQFKGDDKEVVVSDVFNSKKEAETWVYKLESTVNDK